MKNYFNHWGISVILILTTAIGFAQKPPRQDVYRPEPTLLILAQDQNYARNNLSAISQDLLGLDAESSLELVKQETDELGYTHDVYKQRHRGLTVEFAQLKVHAKEGQISSLSNTTKSIVDLDIRPAISVSMALNSAKSFVNASAYLWEDAQSSALLDYQAPIGELMILGPMVGVGNQARLVYKFDIYASEPVYRADVYVDAHNGSVVFENKRIHHADTPATGSSLYNGTVSFTADSFASGYRLRQTADGNGIETYDMGGSTNYSNASDVVSSTTNFSGSTDIGVQAHWGAEQTHQYFMQKHNRNSYTGSGTVIRSYVSYSRNYVNAFWNGSVMTYGDGDGVNYGPLVSLDIVGHEITHGVTEYAANLVYSYESGALNESFSDIFGESIEFFGSGINDWLMGDQIGAGGSGGALRSMSNPNQFGDPDTYLGTNWYAGSGDNGGVHYNSGVQNFWFYLLTEGGVGTNDFGDPFDVPAIGMEAAAAIAYRNLTVYLSTNSQYADARDGAIQSAIDLYPNNPSIAEGVTLAWAAVGVGRIIPPPACQPNPIELTITFDNYPEETAWKLADDANNIIASAVYSTSNPGGSTVNVTFPTLTEGNYTFQITDTYGDGICCAYGNGSYSLSSPDGVFKTGGSFGSSETTEICITAGVDETPPVITLLGDNPFNLFVGQTFDDPGATALDNIDGDISSDIVVTGTVNTGIAGTYTLTYDVTDSAGNAAETQTRSVNVNQDTTPPSVPTNLSASGITTTSFTLSWNASTDNLGVDSYEVFIDGVSQGTQAGTSALISGLNPATQYSATVRALDVAGNASNESNSLSVTTATPPDTIAPTVPGNLTASNIGETSLDISWDASSDNVGVTGYEIFQDGNSLGTTGTTNYSVSGLSPDTTYGFSVRAYDAASNYSAQSAVLSVTTLAPPPDTQAPTVPTNITASNETATSFLLSWSAASDNVGVVGYSLYIDGQPGGTSSTTNFLFEGLSPSTTYSVQVSAYDAAGNASNLSTALSVTTLDPPDTQAPSVPTELTVSNATESSLDVSWNPSNDNTGVTGYELRQNGQSQGTVGTTFTVQTGLNSNTVYTYQVRAFDAAGNFSAWSTEGSARTLEPLPACDDGIQNGQETGVDCGGPDCQPCATTAIVHEGYFENGWDGWVDGGSDCSRYTGGIYAFEGIAAINIQDNSGSASSMSLTGLDLTPYETVTLSFHYYARSMEFNEDFFLQYYDGSGFTTIAQWRNGFEFNGNGFYSDEITLNATDFQNFSTNSGFRFYCDASGNADDIYIDAVVIIGDLGGPDTVPPVITLNGANPMNLMVGDIFSDPWATAIDNIDGDLTSAIVATGIVDTSIPGTYNRTYTVSDSAGNTASIDRSVIVEADTTAPVITLNGANPTEVYFNQPYNEQGATAFDNVDGNVTANIQISGSVDTSTLGAYTVNYSVSDSSGNTASIGRRVNVIADTTPPILTLIGANPMELTVGDTYTEPGYAATDNVDGDLSSSVVVTGSVNTSVAGANTLTYSVTDSSSNTTSVTRVINVNELSGSVVVHEECFEAGWGLWQDGGSDCQYYSGIYSPEGNSSVRIRDNSGVRSSMTLNSQDLSSFTTFSFKFLFQGVGMNSGEDFWLLVRDGNGSWNLAADYIFGVDVVTNTVYEATVTFITANFTNPNNISFRLQNDASSNNDQVYIDCVLITGDPANNLMEGIVPIQSRDMGDDWGGSEFEELTLAPVPAKSYLNVAMSGLSRESTYTIYSVLGQKVQQGIIGDGTVDVKALPSGIYVFEVYDDEERQIKSFVKE